jgi:hypothetical protein
MTEAPPVRGDDLSTPPENLVRSHDSRDFIEHPSNESLSFDRELPPLVVIQQNPFAGFFSEHPILRHQVLDDVLLLAIDPAGEDQEQQLPGLQNGLHVPPNGR